MPSAFWQAAGLLALSNVFMTFAWYALCLVAAVYFVFRGA